MALCPSHRTSGSPCPRQRAESPRGRQGCHMVWLEAESCLVGASPAHAHWPLGPSLAMQGPLTLWSSGDSPSQRLRPGRPWDESSARTRKDVGEIREILCHCGLRCPAGSYSPPHPLSPAAFQGPDFPLPPGWLQPPAPVSPVVFRGRVSLRSTLGEAWEQASSSQAHCSPSPNSPAANGTFRLTFLTAASHPPTVGTRPLPQVQSASGSSHPRNAARDRKGQAAGLCTELMLRGRPFAMRRARQDKATPALPSGRPWFLWACCGGDGATHRPLPQPDQGPRSEATRGASWRGRLPRNLQGRSASDADGQKAGPSAPLLWVEPARPESETSVHARPPEVSPHRTRSKAAPTPSEHAGVSCSGSAPVDTM